ncbi:MFS transporter [Acetobacter sacchari]|uniref:MFS transporter n=1 Tax=Acetobacter sacchari TaxID=2661687 RepID=A0ABS3LZH9_9PROT|nr:MFS transporter [Acetobacter sacchari]MBO1361310.1 MFS transporter [Acetobacter sacchari]
MAISDTLSFREKAAYGCGDLSSNLMWGLTTSYLMFYYTDIYNIPPSSVAWILLVARLFDSVCDPAIGYVVDRAGGLLVPQLIRRLAIPFGLSAFICFLPLPLSPHARVLWAGASYILFGAIYSCINTPYGALATMISTAPQDRVGLNTFRMMGCQIGQFAVALLTIPAIDWLGGGVSEAQRQKGVVLYVLALAIAGSLMWRIVSRFCVVRHAPPPVQRSASELIHALIGNRRWHLCNILVFFQFIGIGTLYGFVIYYVRVRLGGSETFAGELLTLATVMGFLGAAATPSCVKRAGIVGTAIYSLVLQVVAYGAIGFAGSDRTAFYVGFILLSLAQGIASPLYYVLLSRAIDDGEEASDVNTAGLAYAINTLVTKVSMGATGFILAFLLSGGHYAPNLAEQSPGLIPWVTTGFVWLPLATAVVQFVPLSLWTRLAPAQRV